VSQLSGQPQRLMPKTWRTTCTTCSARTFACASSSCPLWTGTAQPVLDPLLKVLLPLRSRTLAAARGPMALTLRSGYEYTVHARDMHLGAVPGCDRFGYNGDKSQVCKWGCTLPRGLL
jgi:hypothetical protein